MKLEIGSQVSWISAAGYLEGVIKNITLSKNAAGKVVPWINIAYENRVTPLICASDDYLKQLKVQLIKEVV